MRTRFLIMLYLYVHAISCQNVKTNFECNRLARTGNQFFKQYPIKEYKLFLKSYLGEKSEFIDERTKLTSFKNVISTDQYCYFKSKSISVKVLLNDTMISYGENDYSRYYNTEIKKNYGEYLNGKNIYIDSIKIYINGREKIIPNFLYSDLININVHENFSSYFPMTFYFNKRKNQLCYYIIGKIHDFYENEIGNINASYVGKIIYDLKKDKWERIIVPSGYLYNYGWPYCDNFWPF